MLCERSIALNVVMKLAGTSVQAWDVHVHGIYSDTVCVQL
jgi:hypothetical protein